MNDIGKSYWINEFAGTLALILPGIIVSFGTLIVLGRVSHNRTLIALGGFWGAVFFTMYIISIILAFYYDGKLTQSGFYDRQKLEFETPKERKVREFKEKL